jgi:hypothetical protein
MSTNKGKIIEHEMVHGPCAHLVLHDKKDHVVDTESEHPIDSRFVWSQPMGRIN